MSKELAVAKANLEDVKERGSKALIPWNEIRDKYFTPEEITAIELKAEFMHETSTLQRKLEAASARIGT